MARKVPVDLDAWVVRVDDLVRAHRAVPRSEMRVLKRHLPALTSRLLARGYEVAGSHVRLPLQTQLLEVTKDGFVPKKGLERKVAGASARETVAAAAKLVERGGLVLVVRESGAGYLQPPCDVVAPIEFDELVRCLTKTLRLIRRARTARGHSVLREDAFGPLAPFTEPATATSRKHVVEGERGSTLLSETLMREIQKRFRHNPLPIRVPDLLRFLDAPADEGKRALLDGAARGLFELEPESGMGRLSHEDAAFCPSGPMGTRLSWVVLRKANGRNSEVGRGANP